MNKKRRKTLETISAKITDICNELQEVQDEEEESLSNIPENLQGSDVYIQSEEACDQLAECISILEDANTLLDEIVLG